MTPPALAAERKPVDDLPVSPLEYAHQKYFVQKVKVGEDFVGVPRLDAFVALCADKRVLHVGCVDWPITDLQRSLHLQLDAHCQLDGFDIHTEAFELMRPHLKGQLFSDWAEVTGEYDKNLKTGALWYDDPKKRIDFPVNGLLEYILPVRSTPPPTPPAPRT